MAWKNDVPKQAQPMRSRDWTHAVEWERDVHALMRNAGIDGPLPTAWTAPSPVDGGPLAALVGRENVAHNGGEPDHRWHISLSRPDRVPDWKELVETGHSLRPGVVFVLGVPPRSWWMNVHENCLHLWEMRDANLEAQWRSESMGHRPS